jgi:hypothetical protein
MLAYCGLDCSKCECYLATQADDDVQRAIIAEKWARDYNAPIKPEHINCDGCTDEGRKTYYCSDLCGIRRCAREKGLAHCALCDEYICPTLAEFINMSPEARKSLERLRNG